MIVTVMHTNQGPPPMQYAPYPPPYMQGGYPMQQPGQGAYHAAPSPYGPGMMQNPCPPYSQGATPVLGASTPPNIGFSGVQGG